MPVCSVCNHFCPDGEGDRYCQNCMQEYLFRLEEISKAARPVVDALSRQTLDPVLMANADNLAAHLDFLESKHGKLQDPAE